MKRCLKIGLARPPKIERERIRGSKELFASPAQDREGKR
jgi:hypothetical protein